MTPDMPGPSASGGHSPEAAEATLPPAAAGPAQPPPEPAKHRKLLYVTLPGCWGALIAGCLSFTPSLLPRTGIIQGIVWGITAAIGYGLGVLAAWIWRAFADRDPRRPRRRSWLVFFISAAVLVVVSFGLGQYWQYEIRKLMGVTEYNIALVVASPFVAALVFCLILLIGRGLRGLYRWVARLLDRWIGRRAAHATGWVLVAGLAYLVVTGLLLQGFVNVMNEAYSVRDTKTAEGIHQPATSLRSGGPGSVIPWDTLGWQGRNFIGKGPSVSDIEKATGQPAMEPIRVYSGLASAPDAEARAALAVRDLERAGGFQRKNLLVVTTTGSGWVDPALVGLLRVPQRRRLGDRGDPVLLPAVVDLLPGGPVQGPRGGPCAVRRGLRGLVATAPGPAPPAVRRRRKPGVVRRRDRLQRRVQPGQPDRRRSLFAGPPNFNTLFREFSDHRDPGSPEVQPVYHDGRIVRFADDATADIPPDGQPWPASRVVYMMHPSDPIVWWSPHLVFSEPDWISEPPGKDVLKTMFWLPFVTFWQVTADLRSPPASRPATATSTPASTSTGSTPSCSPPVSPPRS